MRASREMFCFLCICLFISSITLDLPTVPQIVLSIFVMDFFFFFFFIKMRNIRGPVL